LELYIVQECKLAGFKANATTNKLNTNKIKFKASCLEYLQKYATMFEIYS